MSTSQSAVTVSVEYAKSGRSTCKGCGAAIASGALRLGASTRDPRGFDSTKWYHVACFPVASHPLGPVESIAGFDAIKDDDREKLRELEKNRKTGHTDSGSLDEPSPKKVKTQGSSPAEEVSDKASVSVEYAKSGRSTCKGCNENIVKGSLRIGASFHDPRGFENTKWYHVTCFPTSLYPVFPVEHLKGFDSLEDHDREKLQKLEKAQNMRDSKDGTEKNMEEVKASVRPLDVPSPKKVKGVGVSGDTNISVEYAKSGRSTCKSCNENISKGALRLGASVHDPRGFDSTKWYHVGCFPTSSYPVFRVENLKGFDSIENQDREKVRELEENCKTEGNASDQLTELNLKNEMAQNMGDSKDPNEKNLEEVKNHKRGEASVGSLDKPSPKKTKGVSGEASVSVEYAKSGRSTCKGCNENIAKGALRLGASAHDPRGFDSTKWYHVPCFPISSYPVFPVEKLKGFDSIENQDREKLQELREEPQ